MTQAVSKDYQAGYRAGIKAGRRACKHVWDVTRWTLEQRQEVETALRELHKNELLRLKQGLLTQLEAVDKKVQAVTFLESIGVWLP